ncbi:MAG TPA: hypothetical protein PKB10_00060 [Tepidisphaeraceae bacterium]|nr:hypothetical protein [Tepidisphaeraceae bacterium]
MSLVETLCAVAGMGVLLIALGSSVVWVGAAMPKSTDPAIVSLRTHDALQQFAADLRFATRVIERSDSAITFQVPDRNGDGIPETIRYVRPAATDAPLHRIYNGGTPVVVLPATKAFNLNYEDESFLVPRDPIESAEQQFISQGLGVSGSPQAIKDKEWFGQYFQPSLPSAASHYRVTRARIKLRSKGATAGEFRVRVARTTPSGIPTGTILGEIFMRESSLTSSFAWYDVTFPNPLPVPSDSPVAIYLHHEKDSDACEIETTTLTVSLTDAGFVQTTNSGAPWTINALRSMSLQAWGTHSTPQSPLSKLRMVRVNAAITVNDRIGAAMTSVMTANKPEAP